jgi:hypothetical protein
MADKLKDPRDDRELSIVEPQVNIGEFRARNEWAVRSPTRAT